MDTTEVSNHGVTFEGEVVRKRYTRTERGEPAREWAALVLLDEHARGLAPRPLASEIDPPAVVMSRVAGEPLDTVVGFELDPVQREGAEAYRIVLATFWLLMIPPGNPGHGLNPEGSAELQAVHLRALLGAD